MSSSDSFSESSYDSEDSVGSFEPFDIAVEGEESDQDSTSSHESSSDKMAYADEPLADEEWLQQYEKEEETNKLEKELLARLDGKVQLETWCSCGSCSRVTLQNISECYSCEELDGCKEAMTSKMVLQDVPMETILKCVTQHPRFNAVCLEKWSLRMAAERLRTKDMTRYRQTGSEESYLRSIAYKEFSRLVYGFLGNKHVPLSSFP